MRLSPVIPFGAWEPDLPPLGAKTATAVINAVPVKGGYGPLKELAVIGPAGPGAPKSGIRINGDVYLATATGIYYNTAPAHENIRIHSVNGLSWAFERWGNSIAAVSSLGVFRIVSGVVTQVAGAPGGSLVRRVKDFLVIGLSANPAR
jgi:hypothetical protein